MYGKCIVADYNGVYKDMCAKEFLRLKDCYLVSFLWTVISVGGAFEGGMADLGRRERGLGDGLMGGRRMRRRNEQGLKMRRVGTVALRPVSSSILSLHTIIKALYHAAKLDFSAILHRPPARRHTTGVLISAKRLLSAPLVPPPRSRPQPSHPELRPQPA